MKTKRILLILVAVAAVAGFAYWYFDNRHSDADLSLRLKWVYDPGFAGEMVAAKKGIFEKNGIKVELRPGGFEADPIKLVGSGSDTFGVAGADSFLIARSRGVTIVAFAAGYIDTPVVFYSREEANIVTPTDWKGKRIGIQAGQDTETIYRVLLGRAGLSKSDVVEVPVKYDFSPFLQGQVDVWPGYAASQSYILQQKGINYRTVVPSAHGVKYVGTVYFTTEATLRDHPEWVRAFLKSLVEGWELTYGNEAEAIPAIASYDEKSLTPDLIKWNLDKQKPAIRPEGRRYCEFRRADFEDMQKTLVDQGLLQRPVDLSAAVTEQFLNEVYK
jgi:NitT/TauT family transport system substrate-binding protein